jgi:cytochrome c556
MPNSRYLVTAAGALFLSAVASQCASSKPASPAATALTLLGELKPAVSVKELMESEIDPLADNIFDAVGTEVSAKGLVEKAPKTDDDWAKVRIGAVVLAESANLLKIPRPFAPSGDLNNSGGPNAPELSPVEIQAKVDADKRLWNHHAEHLRAVATEIIDIARRKDTATLLDAGGRLDEACEGCHLEYWYPGDRKFLEGREKKFLEEQRRQPGTK